MTRHIDYLYREVLCEAKPNGFGTTAVEGDKKKPVWISAEAVRYIIEEAPGQTTVVLTDGEVMFVEDTLLDIMQKLAPIYFVGAK